jgi:hypothetical protein
MLRSAARSFVPGAEIEMIQDEASVHAKMGTADLILVNRVLDGQFESDDGIRLIEQLAPKAKGKFMLVSNFSDAQARAEAVGAVPGFGKTNMRSEETRQRLTDALT